MRPDSTSAPSPSAGNARRNRTFHAPLTSVDTVTARLEWPQLPAIVKVSATPAAPPKGRTLLIALPAVLSTSACAWRSPGSEPVRTNVYVHRPANQIRAKNKTVEGWSEPSCEAISGHPTPVIAGSAKTSIAAARPTDPTP